MEIFTGSGEVLSTRLYRGVSPSNHADAGIEFVALDGEATLERVAAYDMARWAEGVHCGELVVVRQGCIKPVHQLATACVDVRTRVLQTRD